jgi:hypothetical protein
MLVASPADTAGHQSDVQISLYRDAGLGSTQTHTFDIRGVKFDVAPDLGSARVHVSLGRFGLVDLTIDAPMANSGGGCFTDVHTGTARGLLRLVPGGRYFGTVRRHTASAFVAIPSHNCGGSSDRSTHTTTSQLMLLADQNRSPIASEVINWSAEPVDFNVSLFRHGDRVSVSDQIQMQAPPLGFLTAQRDLSTATIHGVGPFLTGIAHYQATRFGYPDPGDTEGKLSGTLRANFDSPGTRKLATPRLSAQAIPT